MDARSACRRWRTARGGALRSCSFLLGFFGARFVSTEGVAVSTGTAAAVAISSIAFSKACADGEHLLARLLPACLFRGFERLQIGFGGGCDCDSWLSTRLPTRSSAEGSFFASMLVFSGCVPLDPSR